MSWNVTGTVASLAAALAAGIYTWLTYRLVRSQNEPHVIVYVHHDDSRPTLLEIVVENIGRGLATQLTFAASRPIPHRAFGVSVDTAQPGTTMTEGPLITGVPSLAPGESRRMTWGQFGGLYNALGADTIAVTCEYMHGNRRMPVSVSYLEVLSFQATSAAESDAARLVGEVKRLADTAAAIQRLLQQPK
jgi:hypothetical protein